MWFCSIYCFEATNTWITSVVSTHRNWPRAMNANPLNEMNYMRNTNILIIGPIFKTHINQEARNCGLLDDRETKTVIVATCCSAFFFLVFLWWSIFLQNHAGTIPLRNTNKGIANQYQGFIVSHGLFTHMNPTIKWMKTIKSTFVCKCVRAIKML